MSIDRNNPLETEPAEGSRDVVERELKNQERARNTVDHLPGVKVSGQPQGGAVDRAHTNEKQKG